VPLPSWPYWLVSGITYLSFVGMIGAVLVGAWDFGLVCSVTCIVGSVARMMLRSVQVKRSLHLPRPPALSPLYRRILVVSSVACAVMILALLLGQYVLAMLVGAPAVICLIALVSVRSRQERRLLEEALQ
jgi:hypothetical protein